MFFRITNPRGSPAEQIQRFSCTHCTQSVLFGLSFPPLPIFPPCFWGSELASYRSEQKSYLPPPLLLGVGEQGGGEDRPNRTDYEYKKHVVREMHGKGSLRCMLRIHIVLLLLHPLT